MVIQEDELIGTSNLEALRAFMKLSVTERRNILARQAEEIAKAYDAESAQAEREQWQSGDIVEY